MMFIIDGAVPVIVTATLSSRKPGQDKFSRRRENKWQNKQMLFKFLEK
jgi:hypothetical protein